MAIGCSSTGIFGEATIIGPFVKSYPTRPRGRLERAAELAEAAIER